MKFRVKGPFDVLVEELKREDCNSNIFPPKIFPQVSPFFHTTDGRHHDLGLGYCSSITWRDSIEAVTVYVDGL